MDTNGQHLVPFIERQGTSEGDLITKKKHLVT